MGRLRSQVGLEVADNGSFAHPGPDPKPATYRPFRGGAAGLNRNLASSHSASRTLPRALRGNRYTHRLVRIFSNAALLAPATMIREGSPPSGAVLFCAYRAPTFRMGREDIPRDAPLAPSSGESACVGGYRARQGSPAHHWRLIESLAYTLGLTPGQIKELWGYRKKRGLSVWERAGVVAPSEAEAALSAAWRLRAGLASWLAAEHPDLAP